MVSSTRLIMKKCPVYVIANNICTTMYGNLNSPPPPPTLPIGEDTPSPQFNEDSPKVGSEVEGSPEPEQGDGDQGRPPNCTDKDHDPCQSEGTLVMTISNINKLSDQSFSEPVFIRNLPW